MPRTRDGKWVCWHRLSLTIHEPVEPIGKGRENIEHLSQKSYEAVMSGLVPEYQGYIENPDQ
jgi:1-acyl-sn-glycerol-3-phosphate acyltransferase